MPKLYKYHTESIIVYLYPPQKTTVFLTSKVLRVVFPTANFLVSSWWRWDGRSKYFCLCTGTLSCAHWTTNLKKSLANISAKKTTHTHNNKTVQLRHNSSHPFFFFCPVLWNNNVWINTRGPDWGLGLGDDSSTFGCNRIMTSYIKPPFNKILLFKLLIESENIDPAQYTLKGILHKISLLPFNRFSTAGYSSTQFYSLVLFSISFSNADSTPSM